MKPSLFGVHFLDEACDAVSRDPVGDTGKQAVIMRDFLVNLVAFATHENTLRHCTPSRLGRPVINKC
jgi:hypothetical protein